MSQFTVDFELRHISYEFDNDFSVKFQRDEQTPKDYKILCTVLYKGVPASSTREMWEASRELAECLISDLMKRHKVTGIIYEDKTLQS